MPRKPNNPAPFAAPNEARERLVDEIIELSYKVHFNWGYPDYIREAFNNLIRIQDGPKPLDANRKLSYAELRVLLEEADSMRVRHIVAANPNTPPAVLNFLTESADVRLSERIAENPRTHQATLTRLAAHASASVRMAVADNINTPASVLLALCQDHDVDVRYQMAENMHTPEEGLQLLAADENPYVSSRAQRTLNGTHPAEVVIPDFSKVARRRINRAVN